MLPSVEPLSTTIASQLTDGGFACSEPRQSSSHFPEFQVTITTLTPGKTSLVAFPAAEGWMAVTGDIVAKQYLHASGDPPIRSARAPPGLAASPQGLDAGSPAGYAAGVG